MTGLGPVDGSKSLYANSGLFVWARSLAERGSFSPARKVFVIGMTLAHEGRGKDESSVLSTPTNFLVDDAIVRGTLRFADQNLVPLIDLLLPNEPSWDPHEALAELMIADCGVDAIRSVWNRLRLSGMRMGYPELNDLSTLFVNAHLRAAVKSFDPMRGEGRETAWLSAVLYRFALQHALLARRVEANFEQVFELPDPAHSPEKHWELEEHNRALRMLPNELARLPAAPRKALTLYFGLTGREHTIKEVAEALDTNLYFARLAVTNGLITLAAVLNADGLLSQEELKLARMLLIQGVDTYTAAGILGTSPSTVKRQMTRIGDKVKKSLRRRTVLPRFHLSSGEADMPEYLEGLEATLWRDLTTHHWRLERLEHGEIIVIGEQTKEPVSLNHVRRILRRRVDELFTVDGQIDADIAKLIAPEGIRADLSEDDVEWLHLLQSAVQSSLLGVDTLVRTWKREVKDADLELTLKDSEIAERIRDSLATVTSALEQSMPRTSRRRGEAQLWIHFGTVAEDATFGWVDDSEKSTHPSLLALIRHRLGLVGDFEGKELDLLARCTIRGIQEGWAVLPRFGWKLPGRSNDVLLTWTKPTL